MSDPKQVSIDELRRKLAANEHDRWSRWMQYLFTQGEYDDSTGDRRWRMSVSKQIQWERLMNTPYDELNEDEKETDRIEADKTLAIFYGINEQAEGEEANTQTESKTLSNERIEGFDVGAEQMKAYIDSSNELARLRKENGVLQDKGDFYAGAMQALFASGHESMVPIPWVLALITSRNQGHSQQAEKEWEENDDMIERVAIALHEIWIYWMRYILFSCKSHPLDENALIIPAQHVSMWKNRMDGEYSELTEHEKLESRNLARRIIVAVNEHSDNG